ncbi:MAG TPA: sigma-70 family RNA polymerase sigma factor [Polyangiaceae bacterium]|nr:sigma-70 family RNA polymerase sigma factor [Polyangiaceae bacterium]
MPGPPAKSASREDTILSHMDSLFNFAWRLSGDGSAAEDLVQETLVRAISSTTAVEEASLRAWLFRVLRNLFIDQRRRDRRNPVSSDPDRVDAAEAPEDYLRGDIEIDRLRQVVALDIERALLQLSEDHRAIILLDLEGFTEAETAEAMNCPLGTVKSRRTRARAFLRAELAGYAR